MVQEDGSGFFGVRGLGVPDHGLEAGHVEAQRGQGLLAQRVVVVAPVPDGLDGADRRLVVPAYGRHGRRIAPHEVVFFLAPHAQGLEFGGDGQPFQFEHVLGPAPLQIIDGEDQGEPGQNAAEKRPQLVFDTHVHGVVQAFRTGPLRALTGGSRSPARRLRIHDRLKRLTDIVAIIQPIVRSARGRRPTGRCRADAGAGRLPSESSRGSRRSRPSPVRVPARSAGRRS